MKRPTPKQLEHFIFYDSAGTAYSWSMCMNRSCEVQRAPHHGLYVIPLEEEVDTGVRYRGLGPGPDGWACPLCFDMGSQSAADAFFEDALDSMLAQTEPYRTGAIDVQ